MAAVVFLAPDTNRLSTDDPDMSDEELKKRAAARARAIMARKKREAADFDEEVAGERSKAGNVTGKSNLAREWPVTYLTRLY